MIVSYDNLWKLLIDRKMTKTQMRRAAGISTVTLAKMSKGEPIGYVVIDKICTALGCEPDEIFSYVRDSRKEHSSGKRGC